MVPPPGCTVYILCPNTDSCTMAEKYLSYFWDFGPGSRTDDLECKCCKYPFRFKRKDANMQKGNPTPGTPKTVGRP